MGFLALAALEFAYGYDRNRKDQFQSIVPAAVV
jgi:hypothetical protein